MLKSDKFMSMFSLPFNSSYSQCLTICQKVSFDNIAKRLNSNQNHLDSNETILVICKHCVKILTRKKSVFQKDLIRISKTTNHNYVHRVSIQNSLILKP